MSLWTVENALISPICLKFNNFSVLFVLKLQDNFRRFLTIKETKNFHIKRPKQKDRILYHPHRCYTLCHQQYPNVCLVSKVSKIFFLSGQDLSHDSSFSPLTLPTLILAPSHSVFHACWFFSGDSSRVITVNSSVLPFSWTFSLFISVTISCSLSWAWGLAADAAVPLPSLLLLEVIIRVWLLPHNLCQYIKHIFRLLKHVVLGVHHASCPIASVLSDSN